MELTGFFTDGVGPRDPDRIGEPCAVCGWETIWAGSPVDPFSERPVCDFVREYGGHFSPGLFLITMSRPRTVSEIEWVRGPLSRGEKASINIEMAEPSEPGLMSRTQAKGYCNVGRKP